MASVPREVGGEPPSSSKRDIELEKTIDFNVATAVRSGADKKFLLVPLVNRGKQIAPIPLHEYQDPHRLHDMIRQNKSFNAGHCITSHQLDIDFDYNPADLKPETLRLVEGCFNYFANQTPYKVGRQSKHNSHWLYNFQDPFFSHKDEFMHVIQFLRHNYKVGSEEIVIELRYRNYPNDDFTTAEIGKGSQVMMPGSVHSSGELVYWHDGFPQGISPPRFTIGKVFKDIICAILASYLVPHWVEGNRQQIIGHLSGFLYDCANTELERSAKRKKDVFDQEEEEMGHNALKFSQQDLERLIEGICDLAEDPSAKERVAFFNQTWKRKAQDPHFKTTGGPSLTRALGKDGENFVDLAFRLITGVRTSINIERLRANTFISFNGGDIVDLSLLGEGIPWRWSKQQHMNVFADQHLYWLGKKNTLTNFILSSGQCARVHDLKFMPPKQMTMENYDMPEKFWLIEQDKYRVANLFRNYATAPVKETVSNEEVAPFLGYVEKLFDGNKKVIEYYLSFLAHCIQCPGEKLRTYMVLVGEHGAGKSFAFDNIMRTLMGNEYFGKCDDLGKLFDTYNRQFAFNILSVFEEAQHHNRRELGNKLKELITGPTKTLREMYKDPIIIDNYQRVIIISNNEDDAVWVDTTKYERRANVFKVSEHLIGKKDYWDGLYKWTQSEGVIAKIHKYLLEYKIDLDLLGSVIDTGAKARLQAQTLLMTNPIVGYLIERLQEGYPLERQEKWWQAFAEKNMEQQEKNQIVDKEEWPDLIHAKSWVDDFRAWMRKRGISNSRMNQNARMTLGSIVGRLDSYKRVKVKVLDQRNDTIIERMHMAKMPSKQELRTILNNQYGHILGELKEELELEDLNGIDGLKGNPEY